MGKNVFFAFLGTTEYVPVFYELNERRSPEPEAYVQSALLDLLELPQVTVRIGITQEVIDSGQWERLYQRLERFGYSVESVKISVAAREEQLWEQFKVIGSLFEEGDTLYFDLTHGFRSLSAMALMSIAYFQRLRGLQIGGVYYGALEALLNTPIKEAPEQIFRTPRDLGAWQEKNRISLTAPVFELSPMFTLPAWTEGFATWARTGKAEALVELTRPYLDALRRRQRQERPVELCNLPGKIQLVSDAITLVHHGQIGPHARGVVQLLETARIQAKQHAALSPLDEILGQLLDDLGPLLDDSRGDPLRHQLEIARWLRKHNRFAESLSIVRELASSCAVEIAQLAGVRSLVRDGKPVAASHSSFREKIDGWMMFLSGHLPGAPSDSDQIAYGQLSLWLSPRDTLRDLYREALGAIHEARNKTLHAFCGEHARDRIQERTLEERWKTVDKSIDALDALIRALRQEQEPKPEEGAQKDPPAGDLEQG